MKLIFNSFIFKFSCSRWLMQLFIHFVNFEVYIILYSCFSLSVSNMNNCRLFTPFHLRFNNIVMQHPLTYIVTYDIENHKSRCSCRHWICLIPYVDHEMWPFRITWSNFVCCARSCRSVIFSNYSFYLLVLFCASGLCMCALSNLISTFI